MNKRRLANAMQREMLHSEHAAQCFITAGKRDAAKIRKLEAGVLRAALRWHNYRERHAPVSTHPNYPNLSPHRWASDAIWDKVDQLEEAHHQAIARLADARKR